MPDTDMEDAIVEPVESSNGETGPGPVTIQFTVDQLTADLFHHKMPVVTDENDNPLSIHDVARVAFTQLVKNNIRL